tara:strand:- start:293 stop:727 length:435 start_codon:yes stop_codon:yes gene_type:complete
MTKAQERKEAMYQRIAQHGEDLKTIFGLPSDTDPIKLCKRIKRLEVKAHRLSTAWCNGYFWQSQDGKQCHECTTEDWEIQGEDILKKVSKILDTKNNGIKITLNGDARGYALKLDYELVRQNNWKIYKDWGSNGILAPDLTEGL